VNTQVIITSGSKMGLCGKVVNCFEIDNQLIYSLDIMNYPSFSKHKFPNQIWVLAETTAPVTEKLKNELRNQI